MNLDEAKATLQIELPVTATALKKTYRTMSLFYHPDHGGDPDRFRNIVAAYKLLTQHVSVDPDAPPPTTHTVEGYALGDLGHGYPITESAKACEDCDGNGYRVYTSRTAFEMHDCTNCKGVGFVQEKLVPCRRCDGDGKFKKKDGTIKGECYGCKGTGIYRVRLKAPARCYTCQGQGITYAARNPKDTKKTYTRCMKCQGIGEVKMWNPVLPRGYLRG